MNSSTDLDPAFQSALANAPMILWTIDTQGIVRFATGQGMGRQGLTREQVVGHSIFTLYAGYPVFLENIRKALAGESVQFVLETFDGVFDRRLEPMRDAQGKVTGVVGVAVDVTAEYRARQQVQRSEEQYRNLVEGSIQGIAILREARLVFVNHATVTMFGYPSVEGMQRDFRLDRHFPAEVAKAIQDRIGRRMAGEAFEGSSQARGQRLDGTPMWVEVLARRVLWQGETAIQITLSDITGRKQSEQRLHQREEQYRNLVEGSIQGVAIRRNRRTIFANMAMARMLGYDSPEALLALDDAQVMPPEQIARFNQDREREASGETVAKQFEAELLRKDGTRITCLSLRSTVEWEGHRASQFAFIDITDRKRAEDRLRRSEEQFRALTEGSLQGVIIHRNRKFLFLNQAVANLLGYATPEAVAALGSVDAVMAPEEIERMRDFNRRRLGNEDVPKVFETTCLHRNGSRVHLLVSSRIVDWQGEAAIQSTMMDITDRKRAEDQLRRSEEQFRALTEGSLQGIVIHRNRKFLFVNQAYADALGYASPEEVYAIPSMDDIVAPEERERLRDLSRLRLAGQKPPETYETISLRRDGSRIHVFVFSRMVQWQGEPAIQSTIIDITEQKQTEQSLRESEWQLTRAQQAGHIGTWYRELATGNTRWSDEFYRLLGMQPGDVPASTESFYATVHPEDLDGYLAIRTEGLEVSGHFETELRIVRPDQAVRHMRVVADRVDSAGGEPTALVGTLEDITERRAAEDALRQSEERYRDLVEGSLQGIAIVQDNQYVFANRAHLAMFGFDSLEDLRAGGGMEARIAPHDRPRVAQRAADRVAGREPPAMYEVDTLRKDGSPFRILALHRVVEWNGRPAILVASVDVTERRAAELALQQSEERYRDLIEGSLQGIAIVQDYKYVFTNQAYLKMYGFESLEALQAAGSVDERVAPHERERLRAYSAARQEGKPVPYMYEVDALRRDGVVFPVLAMARIVTWNGRPAAQVTVVDMTERRQLESSLRLKDHAIQSATEAIAFGDLNGRILEVNRAFVKLWGLNSADDAIGRRGIEFWWTPRDLKGAATALRSEGRWHGETMATRPNGETFPVEVRVSTVMDEKWNPVWLMASIVDITERKKVEERQRELEEQLFQAQKMESIGRLVGGIAHDFNNMLTPMLGYAELALAKLDDQHAAHRHVRVIQSAAERAADLTRKMLMFGRRRPLRKVAVDLAAELRNVVDMLERVIDENIVIETQFSHDLGQTEADPALVHQLVMNLALNARDAMPGGGRLTIAAGRTAFATPAECPPELAPGTYIRLLVQDTGEGMTAETQARIFDPFFTTKPEGKGTGLGLSVVYGIVKQHGGHIQVSSKVGAGTTFVIYLPAPTAVSAPRAAAPEADAPSRAATILVVEDDPQVLGLVSTILGGQGYRLLEANGPKAALELLEAQAGPVDLLLCDVVMPEMNGPALSRHVLARFPGTRVLFMSGYAKDHFENQGLSGEGVTLIDKPFTVQALSRAVRKALEA